jgi:hypothetical protein
MIIISTHAHMIITLSFSFSYHKPQLCSYVIHIMTHLHLANDSWNLNALKLYFELKTFSNTTIFNYECFSYVHDRLSSFQFFAHQFLFINKVFSLVLYKINFWVLKFKSPWWKPIFNLLNFKWFFWIIQNSYKSFDTIFFYQHNIKMTLHKYV